jgi:hypothetical protein
MVGEVSMVYFQRLETPIAPVRIWARGMEATMFSRSSGVSRTAARLASRAILLAL